MRSAALTNDTIFSVSSGSGRAGVAVIRISGPASLAVLEGMTGGPTPAPRRAVLRTIHRPDDGEVLDRGLVIWFPGTGSFTGEPSAEFHVHGGRAVVQGVLAALAGFRGCRVATPGEFTRRAFENGKLDLTQVEALDDLIAADSARQRRQALNGLEGRLGRLVAGWRETLLTARALIAAEIDFSDEGDVGTKASAGIDSLLQRMLVEMRGVLDAADRGRRIADGYRVAIVGRPNTGKSSLLNALSRSEAAIVTEHAGTTRDVIEVRLDWDGHLVVLLDTAGVRETEDPVERIGVRRALDSAAGADLVLHLDDSGGWDAIGVSDAVDSIRIRTKSDLFDGVTEGVLLVSSLTGAGLDSLRTAILARIGGDGADHPLLARERQAVALQRACTAVERCLALPAADVELRDHEVRAVEDSLDHLIGRSGVEEILGAVFSRFCVGK